MKIDLNHNELVIKAQSTNFLNSGEEKVKGKLILTNQRVLFKCVDNTVKVPDLEILFDQIADVMFFNTMKIIPNGLHIITKDNKEMRFVLKKRNEWVKKLNKMC